jgi:hypoxanthine phosphoribosyltransferase
MKPASRVGSADSAAPEADGGPRSYDYARRTGVHRLSWGDIARLAETLGERLAAKGVDHIVGVATGGLIPAALVSCALRRELTPVRLSRRHDQRVVVARPVWKVPLTADLSGKRVAIIDDVADTGETLSLVLAAARERGATSTQTACLVAHSGADPAPDVAGLLTNALVVFPWHERVLEEGRWGMDPELAQALAALDVDRREAEPAD